MATRLHTRFYNVNGVECHIYIDDKDYAGSVVEFQTDVNGFVINYQGEETKGKIPVLTSKCDVVLFIENQDIQDFVDDLNTAYEGQFRMLIKIETTERWVGVILPDLVQYEDMPFAQLPAFKLTATDGIKRLQTIPYKDTSGPFAGAETIVEHLAKCISFIGTTDLITTNAWVFLTATDWVPANISAGDPMANTNFEHRALYQVDDQGNYKYSSVYRVIEQLCLRFNCQFRMVNGTYWFVQHNYHEEDDFSVYLYRADGSLVIGGTLDMTAVMSTKFTEKYSGGVYSFMPALNSVDVNYVHFGFSNITQGYIWTQSSQPTIPESPTKYYTSDGSSFMFGANFRYFIVIDGDRPAYLKFGITFKVDANYLQRDAGFNTGGGTFNDPQEIVGSAADYEVIIPVDVTLEVPPTYTGNFAGYDNRRIAFTTIPFPTGGEVEFTIAYIGAYNINGGLVSSGINNLEWSFSNVELTFLLGGSTTTWSNTRRYTGFNTVTGNTERKTVNLIIGEEFGFGRLRIATGSGEENGADWGVGASSAGQTIEKLLATEIMRTQGSPVRKLSATIELTMSNFYKTLIHQSNRWVFYKGKYIGNYDRVEGEWYLLDTTGTITDEVQEDWVLEDNIDEGNDINPNLPPGQTPDIGTNGGGDQTDVISLLDALFPRTNDDIADGATVTSIPIEARTVAGEWVAGQTVTLVNQYTGAQQDFTVTADTAVSDTSISVSSETSNFAFPSGSWIITSQEQQATSGTSGGFYRQKFTSPTSTLTVTENSGNLPANAAAIRLFWENGQWISPDDWSHSGSDITLVFTPSDLGPLAIFVEFNV